MYEKTKKAMIKKMSELNYDQEKIEAVEYGYSDIFTDENMEAMIDLVDCGMSFEYAASYVLEVLVDQDRDEDED